MLLRRALTVWIIGLVMFGTALATYAAWQYEETHARDQALGRAASAASVVQLELTSATGALTDVRGLFDSSDDVSATEFASFARGVIGRGGLGGVAWLPRVAHAERAAYEERAGAPILQLAGGVAARASNRAEYFPLTYIASDLSTGGRVGADAAAEGTRRAALRAAARAGASTLTTPVPLFGSGEPGLVMYEPVYRDGGIPQSAAARERSLIGFVSGAYRLDALIRSIRAGLPPGTPLEIRDASVPLAGPAVAAGPRASVVLPVANRSWTITVGGPAPSRTLPIVFFASGTALTLVLAMLGLVIARRQRFADGAVAAATDELRVSRQSMRALSENSPDVITRFGRDLRISYINSAVERETGLAPEHFIGKTVSEARLPQQALAQWEESLLAVFESGRVIDMEYVRRGADGPRCIHSRLAPELTPEGAVESVLVVSRDITAHRRAEEALRATQERYQALIRSMPDGVVVQDAEGLIVACNPAAERTLGLSADQLMGRASVDPRWRTIREDGSPFPGQQHPAMVTLATGEAQVGVIMGVHRTDGELRWLSVSCERVDADGEDAVVSCFADVTSRLEAEREQVALRRVATLVASEAQPRTVFEAIAKEAATLLGASAGGIFRFDEGLTCGVLMGVWATEGLPRPPYGGPTPLSSETALGSVALTGTSRRTGDEATSSGHGSALILGSPIVSAVAAPIRVNGDLWGAITATVANDEPLPAGAEARLERLGELASLAIMSADARSQLATLASTDHLTGLWNRRAFHERIQAEAERARRHGRPLSLIVFDIDHFKLVNDTHGHPAGDRVLIEMAQRLFGSVREGEIVARVGGEEFAWILPETDAAAAIQAAERLRTRISREPFREVGRLTVSLGVADLEDASGAAELFRLADVALYWAKSNGRDTVFRYSPQTLELMPPEAHERKLERARVLAGVKALARAVDAKDASTQRHSERVADLVRELAIHCGWPLERAALLHDAALVHDVGKIGTPETILMKPGRLTEEEYEVVKEHALLGASLVEDVLSAEQVAWVRNHHERFDGTGYPDGLADGAIPLGASLLSVADAWDAMTSARPYGAPLSDKNALAECAAQSGSQFAPDAVTALREVMLVRHATALTAHSTG